MAQISKYLISKDVYERVFNLFLKTISSLGTKNQTSKFLDGFITLPKNNAFKAVSDWYLLAKGYQYQEISKILKVGLGTIGTMGQNYKYQPGFRSVVRKVLEDEKLKILAKDW